MSNGFEKLLESGIFDKEVKETILEALNQKIDEVRTQVREETRNALHKEIREEFSKRFENDRDDLVEAMDAMITDAIKKQSEEIAIQSRELKEQKEKLTKALQETRKNYKKRVNEHVVLLQDLVTESLKKKLTSLHEEKKAVDAMKIKLASQISEAKKLYERKARNGVAKLESIVNEKLSTEMAKLVEMQKDLEQEKINSSRTLREHKNEINEQTAQRLNELENFVISQLTKELKELKEDHDALVSAKVKLASDSKKQLEETKRRFIERASRLVEETVEGCLKKELRELKEDITVAKQNNFARKIFEAYEAEFMVNYLKEGTRIKQVMDQLTETQSKLDEAVKLADHRKNLLESERRRSNIISEQATRTKTIQDLLRPLPKDKRDVMENLLESVKTPDLKKRFDLYLPKVLNETVKQNSGNAKLLNEGIMTEKRTVAAVTGNRKEPRSIETDNFGNTEAELIKLRRRAGIEK